MFFKSYHLYKILYIFKEKSPLEIPPKNAIFKDTLNYMDDTENEKEIEMDEEFVETDEEGNELGPKDQVKKLREKLKKAVEEKQQYLTNWQKDKAEFVNARKRDEEGKAEYAKFATANVVEDILPALDSFDMAMSNTALWENVSKEWRSGIQSIYDQLKGSLKKHGVEEIGEK
jgi:molecular chaperone GrpE